MLDTFFVYAIAFLAATAAALSLTPVVRVLSQYVGFVDRPDGGRKTHTNHIPLGGGLAVFTSALLAIVLGVGLAFWLGLESWSDSTTRFMVGLLAAASLTVALGIADDALNLKGRYKLLGQLAIAAMLIWLGLRIEQFGVFGSTFRLGMLSIPLTLFWIIGTFNAINLIDGIDGLASSVGLVLCLTVATINGYQGAATEAIIMLALAGALLGFLRYNFSPASIYLGDTGSMLIGLVIGAIAVHTSAKSPAAIGMTVPVAIWSIPILDSSAAFLRRKLTGRSFFTADRGHLHHTLLVQGWSVSQAALFIALISATTCVGAVASVLAGTDVIAFLTVFLVIAYLISTRTFGHIEFALVRDRVRDSTLSAIHRKTTADREHKVSAFRLQGSREWDKLWDAIIESAEEYGLVKFKLSIQIPALHESFFASWESSALPSVEIAKTWKASLPLTLDGKSVGTVDMVGLPQEQASNINHMLQALDFIEPIEDDIRHIREKIQLDFNEVKLRQSAILRAEAAAPVPAPAAAKF